MSSKPQPDDLPPDRVFSYRPGWVLVTLIVVNVVVELVLEAADHGWIGTPLWRGIAYHNGAFWAGLLDNWRPNYAVQPGLMFFSYSFLHSGFSHLAGNMMVLYVLGSLVQTRAGQGSLALIYLVTALTGALGFAALGESYQPMVGASGALFGLAGAWETWEFRDRRRLGRPLWPVWRDIAGLVLLNIAMWLMLGGVLAWEAHFGGFVGGVAAALLLRSRAAGRSTPAAPGTA